MINSNSSGFLRSTISVGLGNLSVMVLGMLGIIIVARFFSAEEFGIFVLLQLIAAFLARASSFGLNISAPRFISSMNTQEEREGLIYTILLFRLLTLPVIALAALLARPLLAMLFDTALTNQFYLFVLVLFALESIGQLLRGVLQGLFLFDAIAKTDLISSILGLLLMVIFVPLLGYRIHGLLYAKALSILIAQSYAFSAISYNWKSRIELATLRRMLAFGLPLQLNDILTFFYLRMDTFMLGAVFGPAQIAYYEVARKIPESISGLYEAFRSVYFPFVSKHVAQGDLERASGLLNNSNRLLSFVTVFGAIVALLFGQEIITLLFSAQYLASVPVFTLLLLRTSLSFTDYTLGYSLVAVGDSDKPVIFNTLQTAVNLLGNVFLIPLYGLVGAAIAGLLGLASVNPLNVIFLQRRGITVQIGSYLKPLLLFAIIWSMAALLAPLTPIAKAALVLLFLIGCALTSILRADDLAVIGDEIKGILLKYQRSSRSQST